MVVRPHAGRHRRAAGGAGAVRFVLHRAAGPRPWGVPSGPRLSSGGRRRRCRSRGCGRGRRRRGAAAPRQLEAVGQHQGVQYPAARARAQGHAAQGTGGAAGARCARRACAGTGWLVAQLCVLAARAARPDPGPGARARLAVVRSATQVARPLRRCCADLSPGLPACGAGAPPGIDALMDAKWMQSAKIKLPPGRPASAPVR